MTFKQRKIYWCEFEICDLGLAQISNIYNPPPSPPNHPTVPHPEKFPTHEYRMFVVFELFKTTYRCHWTKSFRYTSDLDLLPS